MSTADELAAEAYVLPPGEPRSDVEARERRWHVANADMVGRRALSVVEALNIVDGEPGRFTHLVFADKGTWWQVRTERVRTTVMMRLECSVALSHRSHEEACRLLKQLAENADAFYEAREVAERAWPELTDEAYAGRARVFAEVVGDDAPLPQFKWRLLMSVVHQDAAQVARSRGTELPYDPLQ
jgi:hypothetical protein